MSDQLSKVAEARQIIDEFIQCSNVGRSDGKLVSAAKDWLAATDRIESAAAPVGVVDEAMVERAAIAIHNCGRNRTFRGPWDGYFPDYQDKIREQARAALQAAQPAVPSVPVSLRDALEEALRWSPKSFAGSDAIRRFQALAGDYVQRLIEEAAALQAAQPAVPSVPDVFILDRGFKYENGEHTPTVLVGFAPGDFDARDRFAASLAAIPKDQPAQGVDGE